jgi:hypothetical protein
MTFGARALWAMGVVAVSGCGRTELAVPYRDLAALGGGLLADSGTADHGADSVDSGVDSGTVDQDVDSGTHAIPLDCGWPETPVSGDAGDNAQRAACASGQWTFGPIITCAAPELSGDENGGPTLGAGDFDGDGTLDLIGFFSAPQAGAVWSNRGNAGFALGAYPPLAPLRRKSHIVRVG